MFLTLGMLGGLLELSVNWRARTMRYVYKDINNLMYLIVSIGYAYLVIWAFFVAPSMIGVFFGTDCGLIISQLIFGQF